ncbi:MAG: hypothetical protein FJ304_18560 [Planctomycetes bacterium]|nr:hypothetical protein [Planctomycetota bacterium]
MRRVVLGSAIVVLLVVVVVAAQPPIAPPLVPPAPPALPGAPVIPPAPPGDARVPVQPAPLPVATAETPLSRFQPLAAYPQATQFAVRGALLGADWMAKMHQPNGRFLYGYVPALRQPVAGDHDLRQARAALALAQATKFSGDEKQSVLASQSVLALLATTKPAANDPNTRVPVQVSFVCNRVGFAALVALAIYELPNPSDKLTDDAERLCHFLRAQLRTDGSVHYTDGPTDAPPQIDPAGLNEFPGLALHALALSNRARPAEWKKDAVRRGVAHYAEVFRKKPHATLAATLTPAATEMYLQTKLPELANAALDMNDWLCGLQIGPTDAKTPQWVGAFRTTADAPATADAGLHLQSLACAYHLTRQTGDLAREAKYKAALADAVQFVCGVQFVDTNTRHFETSFRANMLIGAFHLSPTDGNLRIDATACAVTGLLRFLSSGAEGR